MCSISSISLITYSVIFTLILSHLAHFKFILFYFSLYNFHLIIFIASISLLDFSTFSFVLRGQMDDYLSVFMIVALKFL